MSFDGVMALRYIASVMKTGGSLEQAFQALTEEAPEPLRKHAAARLSAAQGLLTVHQRIVRLFPEREFRLARAALILAHGAGASVGPLLERCAHQLDDRRRQAQRRQALSAQTVVSGWIVGCMPLGLVAMLALVSPDYVDPLLHTSMGHACLLVSLLLTVSGMWMIRRMVRDDG